MDQKPCFGYAGMGREVVARGSGLDWDTNSICVKCGGRGAVTDYDAIQRREREESPRREEEQKAAKAAKTAAPNASAKQRPSSTTQNWSWLAAIGTFIAGIVVCKEQMHLEGWSILVVSGMAAYLAGRL